ncbi:MAG TPA: DUF4126 family protein [Pyrinomonadaceae bacterium]|nr:DUF4126 family protein [Pyrinomonadaceae bacterium]
MTLFFAFLIGLFAGLRSLTPPAAVAWGVYLGWLKLARPLSLIGSLPAVIILSLLALTELVMDKLPNTPNRTAPLGLIARIVTGALSGACVSFGGGQSALVGAGLGLIGGIVGCFGGYQARAWLVKSLRQPDFNIALLEDLVAIGGSLFIVSRF